jgi:hypothetical protein
MLRLAVMLAALIGQPSVQAAAVSPDEYRAVRSRIEAEYRDSLVSCQRLTGNLRDVCREKAKGREKVARAELEFNRSGSARDAEKLALARADADYEVAKERCEDRTGNERVRCLNTATILRNKARNEAKASGGRPSGE